jgi:hypothetical protein
LLKWEAWMPEFEVIEGGGKRRDVEADMARSRMNTLIIELLRAVARGDDRENRVGRTLIDLFKHMSATDAPVYYMTSGPIMDAYESISGGRDPDRYQTEIADIVLASLRVAAETCASDGFSKGRKSQAKTRLGQEVERHVIGSEKRSREHGWSYLVRLLEDNFSKAHRPVAKKANPETPVVRQPQQQRRAKGFGQEDLKELRKAIKAKDAEKIAELVAKIGQPSVEN